MDKEEFNEVYAKYFNCLTEREERIIKLRFGLVDGKCWSLGEIGFLFNLTRERIRQIEAKALAKLRRAIGKENNPISKEDENEEQ